MPAWGEGVPAWGGAFWGHACSWGDGIPACTDADPHPVDRITDSCKKHNLPTTSFAGDNKVYQRTQHETFDSERGTKMQNYYEWILLFIYIRILLTNGIFRMEFLVF